MIKLPISKFHSLASDYVVLDLRVLLNVLSQDQLPELAVKLCKRKGVVGADGVACLVSFDGSEAEVRIFNPDGSESELCINGLRCAARMLLNESASDYITIRNQWISVTASKRAALADNVPAIAVTVPRPTLELLPPFIAGDEAARQSNLFHIDDDDFKGATLSIPHLIATRKRFASSELITIGEKLQRDGRFPHGINVSYMALLEDSRFFISTFERGGAGLTRSCSSALVCGATFLWDGADKQADNQVTAYSDGGASLITRDQDETITATANATHIYDANLEANFPSHEIVPLFAGSANMDEIDGYDAWLTSLRISDLKRFVES